MFGLSKYERLVDKAIRLRQSRDSSEQFPSLIKGILVLDNIKLEDLFRLIEESLRLDFPSEYKKLLPLYLKYNNGSKFYNHDLKHLLEEHSGYDIASIKECINCFLAHYPKINNDICTIEILVRKYPVGVYEYLSERGYVVKNKCLESKLFNDAVFSYSSNTPLDYIGLLIKLNVPYEDENGRHILDKMIDSSRPFNILPEILDQLHQHNIPVNYQQKRTFWESTDPIGQIIELPDEEDEFHIATIKKFISLGVSPLAKSKTGDSLYNLAVENEKPKIAKLLWTYDDMESSF